MMNLLSFYGTVRTVYSPPHARDRSSESRYRTWFGFGGGGIRWTPDVPVASYAFVGGFTVLCGATIASDALINTNTGANDGQTGDGMDIQGHSFLCLSLVLTRLPVAA